MTIIFQVLFILLIYFLKNVWSTGRHPWNEKMVIPGTICANEECYAQSDFLNTIINDRLNPCDDFYEYVCGNWEKKNDNSLYYPEWSIDSEMGERSFFLLRSILEEPITNQDGDAIIMAKAYYKQCTNLPNLGLYDGLIIASYLRGAGYFPMFHPLDTHSQKKSWIEIHNHFFALAGESALFDITLRNPVERNYEPTFHISDITSPYGLFIPYQQLSIPKLKEYELFLTAVLKQVITHKAYWKSYSLIEKDLMDVLAFRRELYRIKLEYFMTDKRSQYMTIADLDTWYYNNAKKYKSAAHISFANVFKYLYRKSYVTEILQKTVINVQNRMYFRLLARLLSKTPDHVIVNHIHIYFIERHLALNKNLRKVLMDLITERGKLLGLVRYLGKRWHLCIAMNEVKDQLGGIYVKRFFPKATKEKAENLVLELKNMMKVIITDSTWLDDYTKEKSKRVITDMKATIGYPQYYDEHTQKSEFLNRKIIEPGKIDAIYSPYSNRLSISAGYLNPPMFSTRLPDAVSYGATGMTVAHEMYHAFGLDHIERQEVEYFWPQNMLGMYWKKAECFVKQFNGLPVQELKDIKPQPVINGNTTVDENLADTMGLKLAYESFRKKLWMTKKCVTLPNLPGISCLKLFFISFAMSFCTVYTPDAMMEYIEMGIHSSPRLRVNGAVSNMKEFSNVFNCPEGAPLNPQKKCNLWM